MDWYLAVLQKYATFEGRARRKEYWMFLLINTVISIALMIVDNVAGLTKLAGGAISPLNTVYSLFVLLPALAVTVRRLHDTNHSGWWILIAFIPFAGIYLLFLAIKEGDSRRNDFGSNPKAGGRRTYDDEDDLDERPRKKRSRNDDDDDERDDRSRNKRRNDDD